MMLADRDIPLGPRVDTTEDNSKLVKCPFCGESDFLEVVSKNEDDNSECSCYVSCRYCFATGPVAGTPEAAFKKWNVRSYFIY